MSGSVERLLLLLLLERVKVGEEGGQTAPRGRRCVARQRATDTTRGRARRNRAVPVADLAVETRRSGGAAAQLASTDVELRHLVAQPSDLLRNVTAPRAATATSMETHARRWSASDDAADAELLGLLVGWTPWRPGKAADGTESTAIVRVERVGVAESRVGVGGKRVGVAEGGMRGVAAV